MNHQLLIDSEQFWLTLKDDLYNAREAIRIQTLSFEGDGTGHMLSQVLVSLDPKIDIRFIIDSYTKYILSDKFLYTPRNFINSALRKEKKATRQIIKTLQARNIHVKFTSPVGIFLHKFAARNHKKIIVIDNNIVYLGGINFSEHNFAWHDMMLRLESQELAKFLKDDFELTWQNKNYFHELSLNSINILSLDGFSNEVNYKKIFDIIDQAKNEILVHSPYLTFPFMNKLVAAKKRGVRIKIITPENNNRKSLKKYITSESARYDLEVWLYKERMSHLKAMLVDNKYLIMGSSNFDYISFRCHPELVVIIEHENIISEFKKRVINDDLENATKIQTSVLRHQGVILKLQMILLGKIFTGLAKFYN